MFQFLKNKSIYKTLFFSILFLLVGIIIGFLNSNYFKKVFAYSNDNIVLTEEYKNLDDFWKVWNLIDQKFPDANKITKEERINYAIAGLVDSLEDPYSVYFDKEETKIFEEEISGSFGGIGMEVGIKDKILTIISPLKDTPAYKAGFKPGDKILKINDDSTLDMTIDEAIKLIRGEPGTDVTLSVLKESKIEPENIKVTREIINIPTLDTEILEDDIFVIRLYSFSLNSKKLFRESMQKFFATKSNKLILDLRGNPGGFLEAAIDISSWFLDQGKIVVIEDSGNNNKQKLYRSYGHSKDDRELRFVILIDEGSASASEILAGAMQDYGIAKLVGKRSYGKGSVQEVVDVTKDTILKITVAKWLTPKGNSISEKGLTPDYIVDYSKKDFDMKIDPQMNKAIELLNNW